MRIHRIPTAAATLALALLVAVGSAQARDNDDNSSNSSDSSNRADNNDNKNQRSGDRSNQTDRSNQADRSRQSDRQSDRQNNADDPQHHAALGVSLDESDNRVRVLAVLPGSPAAKAGLRAGDEIRSVDDERVHSAAELADEIGRQRPGSKVELNIRRDDERQTIQVRLASQEATFGQNGRQGQRWQPDARRQPEARNQMGQANRQNQGWDANRRASYDENQQFQSVDGQQRMLREVRSLQRQVATLRQEVEELRNQQAGGQEDFRGKRAGYDAGYRGRMNQNADQGRNSNGRIQGWIIEEEDLDSQAR